jgi:hypothetical protein
MMPKPAAKSHGYSNPLDQRVVCHFCVAKESLTTVDP